MKKRNIEASSLFKASIILKGLPKSSAKSAFAKFEAEGEAEDEAEADADGEAVEADEGEGFGEPELTLFEIETEFFPSLD